MRKIEDIITEKKILEIEEIKTLETMLNSDNPVAIYKAMNVVDSKYNQNNVKSRFIPTTEANEMGFKRKFANIDMPTLATMAKTPIIKPIISKRKDQVAEFCQPQPNKYSTGFIFEKKDKSKITDEEKKEIEYLTEFILNCGEGLSWNRDGFETFIRKFVNDTLVYDQVNYEVVRDRKKDIKYFTMVDPTTIKIADSYYQTTYKGSRPIENGMYPLYVQMIDNREFAQYYAWDMSFGIRNPSSSIYNNAYGRSELEDLVQVVTGLLWGFEWNINIFKQGSYPNGILKVKGLGNNAMEDFKQKFRSQVVGVSNAHRMPIVNSDELEFINMMTNNKDMEFSQWYSFLVKLACAGYNIAPEEIGFAGTNSEGKSIFEGGVEQKLKYSKDGGLKPLLRFIEGNINKMIVQPITSKYVFRFAGYDSETEEQARLRYKDESSTFKTLNEVREEQGLKAIENGDIVLNPTYTSYLMQNAMSGTNEPEAEPDFEKGYTKLGNDWVNIVKEALD